MRGFVCSIGLGLGCGPPAPPAPTDPSAAPETVVMVIGCTLRADRLHSYGNDRPTSPYIDALAAQGARFAHTISNAPWTKPGISALLTGHHPLAFGVHDTGEELPFERGLHPDATTLAERFQDAGWTTVGATANPNANLRFGLAQGFDQYADTAGKWRDGIEKIPGTEVVGSVLDMAAGVEGKLYVQVVLVDPHRPLHPEPLAQARVHAPPWSTAQVDMYDKEVRRVDAAIAELDQALAEMGRSQRLLVLAADHAEGLRRPKHAGPGHASFLYDANTRIPFVVHGPGVAPGTVVDGLSQSIDLAPTLVALAGLPPDPSMPGQDHQAAVSGDQGATPRTPLQEVLSSTAYGPAHKHRLTTPDWVLIQNISDGARGSRAPLELYAADDLGQSTNVADQHPEVVRQGLARIDQLRGQLEPQALLWQAEDSAANELEQLEALGYVGGGD